MKTRHALLAGLATVTACTASLSAQRFAIPSYPGPTGTCWQCFAPFSDYEPENCFTLDVLAEANGHAKLRRIVARELVPDEAAEISGVVTRLLDPYCLERRQAAQLLRSLAHESSRQALEQVIGNRFDAVDVRVVCCRALAILADDRAVEFLLQAADDPRIAGTALVNVAALLNAEVPLAYQLKASPVFVPIAPSIECAYPVVCNAQGLQTIVNPRSFHFIAKDTQDFFAQWQQSLREQWRCVKETESRGYFNENAYRQLRWDECNDRRIEFYALHAPASQEQPSAAWLTSIDRRDMLDPNVKGTLFAALTRALYPHASLGRVPEQDYDGRYQPRVKLPENAAALRAAWAAAFGTLEQSLSGQKYASRELSPADRESIDRLSAVLLDPLSLERLEAVQVLHLYHHQAAIPALKQVTENHFDAVDLRAEACRALAGIPDPAVIPVLLTAAEDPRVAGTALTTLSGILQVEPRKEYVHGDEVSFTSPLPRYGSVYSLPVEALNFYNSPDGLVARSKRGATGSFYKEWQKSLETKWQAQQQSGKWTFDPQRRKQFDFILRDWGDKIYPLPQYPRHPYNLHMWLALGVNKFPDRVYEPDLSKVPAPYGTAVGLGLEGRVQAPSHATAKLYLLNLRFQPAIKSVFGLRDYSQMRG